MADDPEGREGIAHLIEHLSFRARPDGKTRVSDLLGYIGAGSEARTSLDTTSYYSVAPAGMLEGVLRSEGARLLNPLAGLDEQDLTAERNSVRSELRERSASVDFDGIRARLGRSLFPKSHSYSRQWPDSESSLDGVTLEELALHAKRFYSPKNVTVLVSGDIDLEAIDELVEATFPDELLGGRAKPVEGTRGRRASQGVEVPDPVDERIAVIEARVPDPELWVGWSLPDDTGVNHYLNRLTAAVAEYHLFAATRDTKLIRDVNCGLTGGVRASVLGCVLDLEVNNKKGAVRAVERALGDIEETWIREIEVGDVIAEATMPGFKLSAVVGGLLAMEDRRERTFERAHILHFSGDAGLYGQRWRAIQAIEPVALGVHVRRFLEPRRARLLYVRPTPRVASLQAMDLGGFDVKVPVVGALARTSEDAAAAALPPGVSGYRTFRLENGLEVIIGKRTTFPVVTAGVLLKGGVTSTQDLPAGVLGAVLGWRTKFNEGNLQSFYGGSMSVSALPDAMLWEGSSASGNVKNLLAILWEEVTSRKILIDSGKVKEVLAELAPSAKATPAAEHLDRFIRALFGSHVYGDYLRELDLTEASGPAARGWLVDTYRPDNAVLAIVGDVNVGEVEKWVRERFSDWEPDAEGSKAPRAPAPPRLRAHNRAPRDVLTVKNSKQTLVTAACLLPRATEQQAATYAVAGELVRGAAFPLVESGVAYSLEVGVDILRGGTAILHFQAAVDNAQARSAVSGLESALELLSKETDLEALDWARWSAVRAYNLRFDTNGQIARALLWTRNLGWDFGTIDGHASAVVAANAADLQRAFQACRKSVVFLLVGSPTSE